MTHRPSTIDPALEAKLKQMRLRLELSDDHTITVKGVPANQRYFNKARTNLLIKGAAGAMPCVVCVDDDLEYTGTDRVLSQAFAAAPVQQGWRILTLGNLGGSIKGDIGAGLECALGILGVEQEPGGATAEPAAPARKLLSAWADDLSEAIAAGRIPPTLFRDEEIEQAAAAAISWEGRMPLILAGAGAGKTNLLYGVAKLLARRGRTVLAVNVGAMMAGTLFESERESLLAALLDEVCESGPVLALEQAEWAINAVSRGPVLLRNALDRGARLIATSTPDQERRFAVHPLASRLETVRLNELCAGDTRSILQQLRQRISGHHAVEISEEIERAVVERSLSMPGLLPGKAIRLLDSAAARAGLAGEATVTLIDVYVAAARMLAPEAA
jgi:ATP-dependent Clp protease ATP-binding subunit ClpB